MNEKMMMIQVSRLYGFLLFFLLSSWLMGAQFFIEKGSRTPSKIDHLPKGKIADEQVIPQDPAYYATQLEVLSPKRHHALNEAFNQRYFRPWELERIDKSRQEMEWAFRAVTQKPIFRASGRRIGAKTYRQWIANANFQDLDSLHRYGITTRHVDLKALPTRQPFYRDPNKVGEGFPFDYNQNSSYHINTPLYLSHYSKDKKWAFVRGPTAYGWIEIHEFARVDTAFMSAFRNDHYAVTIQDDLLLTRRHHPRTILKLGTIFPYIRSAGSSPRAEKIYLFATRDKHGGAVLTHAAVLDATLVATKPLAFTSENVSRIARELYGEPYGWGGLLQTRDCSSTTKDFFAVFGVFLRRNSTMQATEGHAIALKGMPKKKKKQMILEYARPFQSMLYVPGHIALYLGEYQGEPVIMHSYWGARLDDDTKHILARTVITTTEPGKELKQIKESSKLANTLEKIINLTE
jgi:cell wall-associated NlpC family hydrolase